MHQRLRVLAVAGVAAAGSALVICLDSGVARAVVVVLAVGAAALLGGGSMRQAVQHSSGEARDTTAADRDVAADLRDRVADRRDRDAGERDQAAEQRDQASEQRDRAGEQPEGRPDARIAADRLSRAALARREAAADRMRASQDRGAGASGRANAELDRDSAVGDRSAAASGRAHAELDRASAMADREAGIGERAHAGLDREEAGADRSASASERQDAFALGGLRSDVPAELAREVDRASASGTPLVVAFVAVGPGDDTRGDDERLLDEVAQALRAGLRTYDLVLRHGSAELVCALPGLDLVAAAQRFERVDAALAVGPGSVTVGLAELASGDSAGDLVARADAARRPGGR